MNPPLRKLTVIVIIMFLALIVALTYIHFFQAPQLNADARNVRTIYREYDTDRGSIVVAGVPIAQSDPVDDQYNFQRVYAQGQLYAHLTGYFSVVHSSKTGLEASQDSVLSGGDDSLFSQRLQDLITGKQPQGGSVSLTIDPKVQTAAAEALGDNVGAVAAIEPTTGRILALYSSPSFDPNLIASHDSATAQEAWNSYNSDSRQPLLDRAVGDDLYAPGSTFKIITAAAMLEAGATPDTVINAATKYKLPGTETEVTNLVGDCGDGSGQATLRTALVLSCNTAFAEAGIGLGADTLMAQAQAFGFDQDLEIGIPVRPSRFPRPADDASLGLDSFGQKDIQASPLQMAMVGAAVANHGSLMQPYIVEQTLTSDLEVVSTTKDRVMSTPISRTTADALTSMMQDIVQKNQDAQVDGVVTAGKTGTAENSGDPHAWYVGFEVAENSRVAVAVFVQNGGSGATVAAPIAAAVIYAATH